MSKSKARRPKRVKTIPIDQIRFLNPRVRNRRNFQEIVQSIANVGLKRPITVSPRKSEADSASYDLVCGQGRITAVEAGILPLNMAIEIAKSSDEDVQHALTQAYTEKKLRGKKLVAVRRIIEQRRRSGKHIHDSRFGRRDGAKRPLTGESIIRVYRQEADRQKLLVKKAEVTQSRLLFIVEAIRELRDDENFANLLKAERLDTMPAFLEQRIADGIAI